MPLSSVPEIAENAPASSRISASGLPCDTPAGVQGGSTVVVSTAPGSPEKPSSGNARHEVAASCPAAVPSVLSASPGPALAGAALLSSSPALPGPAADLRASGLVIRRSYSSRITNPKTKTQKQEQEQKTLNHWEMLEQARRLLPENTGLAGCGRYLIPAGEKEGVKLLHLPKTMGARLVNVQRCGSVWPCPICAPKISQHRQKELLQAVDTWIAGGGALVMCGYTFQHSKQDTLPALLGSSANVLDAVPASGLLGARSVSMSGRAYSDLKKSCGMVGSVRCLEVTFGDNGPHPHIHELPFLMSDADFRAVVAADEVRCLAETIAEFARQKELTEARGRKARARRVVPALVFLGLEERHNRLVAGLEQLWHEGLAAVGLSASKEHGFHASEFGEAGNEAAEYVSKPWNVAAELTMQPVKVASKKGKTPMQLLADCTFGEGAAAVVAGERFASYARAMKGRRQLVWSNGLRALLHLGEELTDEQAADCAEDEGGLTMGVLSPLQWRLVAADGNQGRLVNVVKSGDADRLAAFLEPYADRPYIWGDDAAKARAREWSPPCADDFPAVADDFSADPFADDLPAALVAQAVDLAAASGETFSAAVAIIERVNAAVALWG